MTSRNGVPRGCSGRDDTMKLSACRRKKEKICSQRCGRPSGARVSLRVSWLTANAGAVLLSVVVNVKKRAETSEPGSGPGQNACVRRAARVVDVGISISGTAAAGRGCWCARDACVCVYRRAFVCERIAPANRTRSKWSGAPRTHATVCAYNIVRPRRAHTLRRLHGPPRARAHTPGQTPDDGGRLSRRRRILM